VHTDKQKQGSASRGPRVHFVRPAECLGDRREVLYKILIESGVQRKLVRLIKRCSNETYGMFINKSTEKQENTFLFILINSL
jgi:hypothetical protein